MYIVGKHDTENRKRNKRFLIRLFVTVWQITLAIAFAKKLDKFFSLLGALLCAPLAFTMPTLIHLKLVAETKMQRLIDWSLIIFSLVILVLCTA